MLLQEVDEPLGVSMDKRLGWFPVVVTGIKAPPLTQKFPFALGVTSCFNNPLEFVLPPSMTRSDKCFAVQKRGLTRSLGEGISLLRRSPETSISLLTSTRILHLFSPRRAVTANGPSHKGRSLSSPSRVVSDFRSQTRSSTSKLWGFFDLDFEPKASQLDASRLISTQFLSARWTSSKNSEASLQGRGLFNGMFHQHFFRPKTISFGERP